MQIGDKVTNLQPLATDDGIAIPAGSQGVITGQDTNYVDLWFVSFDVLKVVQVPQEDPEAEPVFENVTVSQAFGIAGQNLAAV